jgi:hypothetical protein
MMPPVPKEESLHFARLADELYASPLEETPPARPSWLR